MFPGVSGFHWSPIHIVFLTLFNLVLMGILSVVTLAWRRTRRHLRSHQAGRIRWHVDFEDLPAAERQCRHALTQSAPERICPRAFDCRECGEHARFAALESGMSRADTFGLDYPEHRFYHRGHTWVEPQPDGTVLVGLDDLGARVTGRTGRIAWPKPGVRLVLNGPAWSIWKGKQETQIRAPLDGTVISVEATPNGECLRLRPLAEPLNVQHLLQGPEVSAWLRSEVDRLQIQLSTKTLGATLADGGELLEDLPAALPNAPWDEISASIFLEP